MLLAPGETAKLCANRIAPRMFMNPAYASLYELLFEWEKAGQEVSLNWLVERMERMDLFQELGGRSGLAELYAFDIAANAEFNIGLVIEQHRRRELILHLESLKERCYNRNDELPEILKTAKDAIAEIGVIGGKRLEKLLEATLSGDQLDEIKIPPRTPIIKDWLMEGDLGFAYAYRGSGKTWFVLTRADRLERAITAAKGRKAKLEVIRKSDLEVLQMFADLVKPLKSTQNGESAAKQAS